MAPRQNNTHNSTMNKKQKSYKSSGTSSHAGSTAANNNGNHPQASSSVQHVGTDPGSPSVSTHDAATTLHPIDLFLGHREDHLVGCVFTGIGCANNSTTHHHTSNHKVTGTWSPQDYSSMTVSVGSLSYYQPMVSDLESAGYHTQTYDQICDFAGQGAQFGYSGGEQ